jgi:hypothetical protein
MSTNILSIEDIKKEIVSNFGFLSQDFRLYGPQIIDFNTSFSVGYFAKDIGVEIQVDLPNFFIYILIFLNSDNTIPFGYTSFTGKRQKRHLQHILKKLNIIDNVCIKDITILGGDYRNYSLLSKKLSRLLRDNWPVILAKGKTLFD